MVGPRESPMDEHQPAGTDPREARTTRRNATSVTIRAPEVVAINDRDYQQALAALKAMIGAWWRDH
jgi:hypothetical protein